MPCVGELASPELGTTALAGVPHPAGAGLAPGPCPRLALPSAAPFQSSSFAPLLAPVIFTGLSLPVTQEHTNPGCC